jgi:hypothetical protein
MLRNFAGTIANREVSDSWVTRFLQRHNAHLITKWSAGIDRNRHQADSRERYQLYFDLLHSKIQQYSVEARNTYNMDEKGFFVGITARSKRIFTKRTWVEEKRTAAIQDGSRKWITLLACVCASGEALPPALIYQGSSGLQSSWLDDVEVGKHEVFFSNSPTGWTNNDLGIAWLEQVFERFTKSKARRQYRLLILDGHGSHVTSDFIDFCDSNKILLAIFPPHATHSLQPLDVVVFAPLAAEYSRELDRRSQRSQGLATAKKDSFFKVFWEAWSSTMKPELILKSFQATGVWPMDAEVVLKRFSNHTSRQAKASKPGQRGDGDSWIQLRKLYHAAVPDKSKVEARQLEASFHSLQTQNELLHLENNNLKRELTSKSKHKKKRYKMDLQHNEEYKGAGVFWSPKKVAEARTRETSKRNAEKELQLQKARDRDLKAAANLYKKQIAEAAKVARQEAAEERRKEKKAKAEELAAARALKKQQRDAATAQKSHDTLNRPKRKASHKPSQNPIKRRRVVAAQSGGDAGPPLASPPPKISTRGRQIKTPAKFK